MWRSKFSPIVAHRFGWPERKLMQIEFMMTTSSAISLKLIWRALQRR
jgi:hypothetical protein